MITIEEVGVVYKVLLGREPESQQVVQDWCRQCATLEELTAHVLDSAEFRSRLSTGVLWPDSGNRPMGYTQEDLTVFDGIDFYKGPGKPGFVTDFLGNRTCIEFISQLADWSGRVEGIPVPGNFHAEAIEWIGVIRAVRTARQSLVAVELGAGWGPWLVISANLAQRFGISKLELIGVEADETHVRFMHSHFVENGLDPEQHRILRGVADERDGTARFPVLENPAADWGAGAGTPVSSIHCPRCDRGRRDLASDGMEEVQAYCLATLLDPYSKVDLIHCDIQGAEARVLIAGAETLDSKVRWIVVGTHSRLVEGQLIEHFLDHGWQLTNEAVCSFDQVGSEAILKMDGCQVWRNLRFD